MHIDPLIIGHGIEPEGWRPGTNGGYLLWNKSRNVDVCDPRPGYELSRRGYHVRSTYAPVSDWLPNPAYEVIGHKPWEEMRSIVQEADIYLATTRETFGVGTLEAMAAGVPVLGYAWGGTLDIVRHGIDGYLARPGDLDDLEAGLLWIREHREEISEAATTRAREFDWKNCMKLYANLYNRTAEFLKKEQHRVAVVIPCHNYGRFLRQSVNSVLHQSRRVEEIVIVDDGSTDDTPKVVAEFSHEPSVRYVRNEKALGVAAARNIGIALTESELLVCLDADDWLDPRYTEYCRRPMVNQRELGIVYTGLDVNLPTGQVNRSGWPPPFSWETQSLPHVPPNNCVSSAAMFRRTLWERSGGYKQAYAPGEDAEFWTRGLSLGFEALRVDDMPLFHYRVHKDSASRTKRYVAIDEHHPWMLDRNFPLAAPSLASLKSVRSYAEPLLTVVLEDRQVLPLQVVADALDDLLGQRWRSWEVIVMSRRSITPLHKVYPFARWAGSEGEAIRKLRGQLVLWHPVDIPLEPDFLLNALRDMVEHGLKSSRFKEGVMGCCGGNADPVLHAKRLIGELDQSLVQAQAASLHFTSKTSVRMEFIGDRVGAVTYHGRDHRTYRGGNNAFHRFANVHIDDVPILLGTGQWRTVAAPPAPPVDEKVVAAAEVQG